MRLNAACAAILALSSGAALAADEYRMVDLGSPMMPESHMRPHYATFAGLSSNGHLGVSYWYGYGDFDFDAMIGRYSDEKGWEYTDRLGCATAINSRGDVTISGGLVGEQYSWTQRCTVWHADGTFTELPANLRAGYEFRPFGINAAGDLVGELDQTGGAYAPHPTYPALIKGLNVDVTFGSQSAYVAINDAGYSLWMLKTTGTPYVGLYKPGQAMQYFPRVSGYTISYANSPITPTLQPDFNELNEVAAWKLESPYYVPMIYRLTGTQTLPVIPGSSTYANGRVALNDNGQVVADILKGTKRSWVIWTGTKYIDLTPLLKAGWSPYQLIDVDNRGRVYGCVTIPGGSLTMIRLEPTTASKNRKSKA